jgi:hypothetical protein
MLITKLINKNVFRYFLHLKRKIHDFILLSREKLIIELTQE